MNQRQILTDRFIVLFHRLSEQDSLPYKKVASILDITIKTLNDYLNKTHLITIEEAYIFCTNFVGDYEYMFQDITNWQLEIATKLRCGFESKLPAIGGYSNIITLDFFTPNVSKKVKFERKNFNVNGDSMTGGVNNIEQGDKLETVQITSILEFKENKPYVIETGENIYVKQLVSIANNGKLIGFKCISDLYSVYAPFDVFGNEKTKIYEIKSIYKESFRIKLRNAVGDLKVEKVLKILIKAFPEKNELILLQNQFNSFLKLEIIGNNISKRKTKQTLYLLEIINSIDSIDLYKVDLSTLYN